MGRIVYFVYGLLVIAGLSWAGYRGMRLWPVASELHNVPKTVRQNPGSYRTFYYGSGSHYRGGK